MSAVVDTNVALVAQGLTPQADPRCVDTCLDRLINLLDTGGLLLDERDEIVREYVSSLGRAGRPGIGKLFAKWAWDNRFDSSQIRRVSITPSTGGWRRYEEFPNDQRLSRFHSDDQKFVAVALASGDSPPILNAVDSDWWNHEPALRAVGVQVEFLCPQHSPTRLRPKRRTR